MDWATSHSHTAWVQHAHRAGTAAFHSTVYGACTSLCWLPLPFSLSTHSPMTVCNLPWQAAPLPPSLVGTVRSSFLLTTTFLLPHCTTTPHTPPPTLPSFLYAPTTCARVPFTANAVATMRAGGVGTGTGVYGTLSTLPQARLRLKALPIRTASANAIITCGGRAANNKTCHCYSYVFDSSMTNAIRFVTCR